MRWASVLMLLMVPALPGGCDSSGRPGGEARPSSPGTIPTGKDPATPATVADGTSGLWGCTMCPAVQSRNAGECPTCGMALVVRHGTGAFVCLEHVEDGAMDLEPGTCRRCGREFEAALTRLVDSCATHEQVLAASKGPCAVCGEETHARRMAVIWECDDHGLVSLDGGACARCGKELVESLVALPHGDHSPKHGGLFFMAPDRWHHLEGALIADDTFRLYLYDNFTRPLSTGGVTGSVRVGRLTADGDIVLDEVVHELRPVSGTNYFEATSEKFRPPLDLALALDLSGGKGEPDRFDFTFDALSKEPVETTGGEPPPQVEIEVEIPDSRREILRAIEERRELVLQHIDARRLALVYRPALEAKELVLALEAYAKDVPAERRSELARALYQSVRGAWLLDLYGDLGELAKVREAHAVFATGVDRLKAVFPPKE